MFPLWVYFVVAAALAMTGYAIGQLIPGMGMPFVALSSTLWVAFVVSRQRKLGQNCRD